MSSTKVLDEDGVIILTSDIKALADATYATVDGIRENLLDNWYFVGGGSQQGGGQFPINQRGQTTYSSTTEYTIDRWFSPNGTISCSLNSSYIQVDYPADGSYRNFGIYLPESITAQLAGKTVTASILLNETTTEQITLGCVYTGGFKQNTVNVTNSVFGSVSLTLDSNASGRMTFFVQNGTTNALTLKIKAVKLELGSTQTLAHQENGTWVLNEIPNYTEQLFRCQTAIADSGDVYANRGIGTTKMTSVTLTVANWSGSDPYSQTVSVSGGTANSKVDLQPTAAQLAQLISDGVASLLIENNSGTFTAYAVGATTSTNMTIQATITEVTT